MLLQISQVLDQTSRRLMRDRLNVAQWVDGRATAGHQGARVKHNRQLAEHDPLSMELGGQVLAALERNALFISAVLPNRVYPPLFNRYEPGMSFGAHVDNAVRMMPGGAAKIRTDVSATLFLSEPEEYDGGELLIEDSYGPQSVKLRAGDMVVYPADSLHRVVPVTRGARVCCFFWVQSLVRDDKQRALLFEMDRAVQRLQVGGADASACLSLTNCYHNLLRQWSEC